ncbi:MAG: radical SAM protein [Thermodesulfobacteriota bacterium]|nr:radical SAM protein [Thermodesulfobacteriota bacterium]
MHITLINPPSLMATGNYSTISHPPVGLACLSAYLQEQGHTVTLIDAVGEGISGYHAFASAPGFILQGLTHAAILEKIPDNTDILGISCMFSHAWAATRQLIRDIAGHFPRALVVAGGEHITAMYALCLKETPLSACVLGEGEETMADLAHALEHGIELTVIPGIACLLPDNSVVVTPPRQRIADLDRLPFPDWQGVPLSAYTLYEGPASGTTIPMLATRGCPHDCTFCSAPRMWGIKWVARSPENIVAEMTRHVAARQVSDFQFPDINPFVNPSWTQDLCRKIIKELPGITWQMPVGTSFNAIDEETAKLLVASGCDQIQYAPESGSPRVLAAMNKHIHLDRFLQAVAAARAADMRISVLFILGYPGETPADVRKTLHLIRKLAVMGVHEIAVSSFVPLPGTTIFKTLLEKRRIKVNDDYLLAMASATSLFSTRSWNPGMSDRRLLILKWLGLLQFFLISWMVHPRRLVRRLTNLATGAQQTKADRVLREMMEKRRILRQLKRQQNISQRRGDRKK